MLPSKAHLATPPGMLLPCASIENVTAGRASVNGLRVKGGEKVSQKAGDGKALTVAPDAGSAERT